MRVEPSRAIPLCGVAGRPAALCCGFYSPRSLASCHIVALRPGDGSWATPRVLLRGLSFVLPEFDVKLNGQDARFEVEFARFGIRVDLCLCAAAEIPSREAPETPFPTHLQPCSSKRALRRRRAAAAPAAAPDAQLRTRSTAAPARRRRIPGAKLPTDPRFCSQAAAAR